VTKQQLRERDEARAQLRGILPPGSTVYTLVTHVARSGMSRRIRVLVMTPDEPHDISHLVGRALGYRRNRDDGGLVVGGCGMDMGFHLVHSLSYTLHGNATVGADAQVADEKGRPFQPRPDNYRAGYSLTHRWL
jgi:hypothetical protein